MDGKEGTMPRFNWPAVVGLILVIFGVTAAVFIVEWDNKSFGDGARTAGPWFGGLVAVVLVFLTAMYVVATQQMAQSTAELAKETRRTREDLSAPAVVPFFSFERRLLMINVENIGAGIARNVRVNFAPPIPGRRGDVAQLPVNEKPIPVLRPHERFSHFVDVAPTFFSKDSPKPKTYLATVSYDSAPEELEYPLDLSVYEGMLLADEHGVAELVKEVEQIRRILGHITDLSSLHIKTPQDLRHEEQEWQRRLKEERQEEAVRDQSDTGTVTNNNVKAAPPDKGRARKSRKKPT